jgi:hypothetical protein
MQHTNSLTGDSEVIGCVIYCLLSYLATAIGRRPEPGRSLDTLLCRHAAGDHNLFKSTCEAENLGLSCTVAPRCESRENLRVEFGLDPLDKYVAVV